MLNRRRHILLHKKYRVIAKEQSDCGNLIINYFFLEIAAPDETGLAMTAYY